MIQEIKRVKCQARVRSDYRSRLHLFQRKVKFPLVASFALLSLFYSTIGAQPRDEWRREYEGMLDNMGELNDLFAASGNRFAMTGQTGRSPYYFWLIVTDNRGEPIFQNYYPQNLEGSRCVARSIVQLDDGGYIMGGKIRGANVEGGFGLIRTDENGNMIWWNRIASGDCYAVIELKDGNIVAVGETTTQGGVSAYIVKLDLDGQVQWSRVHDQLRYCAIREIDDGFLTVGWPDSYCCKMDDRGEIVDIEDLGDGPLRELISCRGEGYMAVGTNQGHMIGIRFSQNLERIWRIDSDNFPDMKAVAIQSDGGFVIGGGYGQGTEHLLIRVDRNGNYMWSRQENEDGNLPSGGWTSLISDENSFVYAVGSTGRTGGILIKVKPDLSPPKIVMYNPETHYLKLLSGDTCSFFVEAIDYQEDSLWYEWKINRQQIDANGNSIEFEFQELGLDTISCFVFDTTGYDSIIWHITVTDLYISAFTPDTLNLTLRRGSSVDFSVDTVRYTEGDPPEYLWTVTNLDNPGEPEIGGSETAATITFNQSGNYSVEGLAFRNESSDAVTWNVTVRGAIWAFAPEELVFEVLSDSLVQFDVLPTVPDAEGQTIRWLVDGEVVAEDTTGFTWRADFNPPYLAIVQVVVADTVESDTVSWEVTVREPDGIQDGQDVHPTRYDMLSVSPNPFNSTLTIRFDVGARHAVPLQIAIYDISGRMVAVIPAVISPQVTDEMNATTRRGAAAENSVVWDASSIPAGVYFVRLQSGRNIATKKVLLMK